MKKSKNQRWISLILCLMLLVQFLPEAIITAEADQTADIPYYGRSQLAQLSNAPALLYAYDAMVSGVDSAAEEIVIYNGTDAISQAELHMVVDAYFRDHTEHFWFGDSYSIMGTEQTCHRLVPTYTMTGSKLSKARTAMEKAADQILSGLKSSMSEGERALYLHDRLASAVTYQFGANAHNAYGALVEGAAVCDGYAKSLQYLLRRAGIQGFIALGSSTNPGTGEMEAHAWNYVRIDGQYYHVDLTWDDQGADLYHMYFNQSDRVIREDHVIAAADYPLPACTAEKAMYFTGKDTKLDSYDVETVAGLLKNNGYKVHVYIPGSVEKFARWFEQNIVRIAEKAQVSGTFTYGYMLLGREMILTIHYDAVTPTEPQPTQPAATDPQPTQPAATDPQPTQPAATEPQPTQPRNTNPPATGSTDGSEPTPSVPVSNEADGETPAWILWVILPAALAGTVVLLIVIRKKRK